MFFIFRLCVSIHQWSLWSILDDQNHMLILIIQTLELHDRLWIHLAVCLVVQVSFFFFAIVVVDQFYNLNYNLIGAAVRGRHSFSGKATVEVDPLCASVAKPFGIGKFLTSCTVLRYHHRHWFFLPSYFLIFVLVFCFVLFDFFHKVFVFVWTFTVTCLYDLWKNIMYILWN